MIKTVPMKRLSLMFVVLCLMFTACSPAQVDLPVPASASASHLPAINPTQTSIPATPTISPTPTPLSPVLQGTPIPLSVEVISAENAARVTALATWGNGTLSSMALSPDGQTLAVASSIGVALYSADTLELYGSLPTDESVNELAYSPDGQTLVLGLSNSVLLWNLPGGGTVPFDISEMKNTRIDSLAYSPDGKWLVIGTEDKDSFYEVAYNQEGGVYVFEAATGKLSARLLTPEEIKTRVAGLVFSPDSQVLAVAVSGDFHDARLILLWDTTTWQLQTRFDQEVGIKNSAALTFSPDGKTLAFPGDWIALWLLNLTDGTSVRPYAETDGYYFQTVAISPDGRILAAGGSYGLLTLWDTATGNTLRTLQKRDLPINNLAFSPDGKYLYAGSTDGVRLWDISSGELKASAIYHTSFGKVFSFSPDGKRLATLVDDEIIIWDAASGKQLQTFAGHNFAAISPDWSRLATVSLGDQVLWLYDLASGRLTPMMDRGEHQMVEDMYFSPDRRVLAQVESGDAPQLLLWDTTSGNLLHSLPDAYSFLAFSPDGKTFAAVSVEIIEPSPSNNIPPGKVLRYLYVALWDVASGTQVEKILVGGGNDNFYALSFSPDGKSFVVQIEPLLPGITLSKWSQERIASPWSLQWTFSPEGHNCLLGCPLTISPNGAVLALGGRGNQVVSLVDMNNGTLLADLAGHNHNLGSLWDYTIDMEWQIFSPDGKQLVTSGEDGLLYFWGIRP